jgi:hypothetical protein
MQVQKRNSANQVLSGKGVRILLAVLGIASMVVTVVHIGTSQTAARPAGPQYSSVQTSAINRPGAVKGLPNLTSSQAANHITAAQAKVLQQKTEFQHNLPAPTGGKVATNAVAPTSSSPALSLAGHSNASPGAPLADTDLAVEVNSTLPGPCCFGNSSVFEPSVAAAGKEFWLTGNWTVDFSNNAGASWFADNPLVWAGGNFCCDQQVIYEPGRDVFMLLQMDTNATSGNGLELSMFKRDTPGTFLCQYFIDSTLIGMSANQTLDFPDIQFSTDYTYLTWNTYTPNGATWENTAVVRLSTSSLAGCAGLSGNYFTRTDVFSMTLVSGSVESMNMASNWFTDGSHTNGTYLRFFNWAESTGSLGVVDLAINPFAFYFRGGANCGSPDAVVHNWCARADSRRGTGYLSRAGFRGFGGQVIGFAFNANAGGGFNNPYVVREYFVLPSLTYKGNDYVYFNNAATAYGSFADSPYRGYVGGTVNFGGGSGDFWPGTLSIEEDKASPAYPWAYFISDSGGSNPGGGVFGDFNTTREYSDHLHTVGGSYATDGAGNITVHFILWGRARDHNSFLDWTGV